jgi:hypothetical protein
MLPADRIATSLSRITTPMMGRTFRASTSARPEPWRAGVLRIAGARPLTIALSSDRDGCAKLAAAMLKCDERELELRMIDDFLRELVNMTAGVIRTELRLDQELGLARAGAGLRTDIAWTHHVLGSESIRLVVSFACV